MIMSQMPVELMAVLVAQCSGSLAPHPNIADDLKVNNIKRNLEILWQQIF